MTKKSSQIYQFKITLEDITPKIWRRILVPENYSFWDLHVAIQCAMGWTDSHLHQFTIIDPKDGEECYIGMPDDESFIGDAPTVKLEQKEIINNYFTADDCECCYEYDFGDCWTHNIRLEKVLPAMSDCKYPICTAGKRACPPEDCGGIYGYEEFLAAIQDPKHEEHENMLEWVGGNFDPDEFDTQKVHFKDPKKRWKEYLGA